MNETEAPHLPDHLTMNPNDIRCEICVEAEAGMFCRQCAQYFCEGCQRSHKRQKGTIGHLFVSIDQALTDKLKERTAHCHTHPGGVLSVACTLCDVPACPECLVEQHSGHPTKKLEVAAQEVRDTLKATLLELSNRDSELARAVELVFNTAEQVRQHAKVAEEEIRRMFATLRAEFDRVEATVLGDVGQTLTRKEKDLMLQKDDLDFVLTGTRQSAEFARSLAAVGKDDEVVQSKKLVMTRLQTLRDQPTFLQPVHDHVVDFDSAWYQQGLLADLGRVAVQVTAGISNEHSLVERNTSPGAPSPTVNKPFSFRIVAVNSLGQPVKHAPGAEIPFSVELNGPTRVAVDIAPKEVEEGAEPEGVYIATFTPTELGNHSLSVYYRGRHLRSSPLVISVTDGPLTFRRDFRHMAEHATLQFGAFGTECGQFRNPRSVSCTIRSDIVVADSENNRVQVFSKTGEFLRQFGTRGAAPGELDNPCGLTVDLRTNDIVVADHNNHRVQVFDESGRPLLCFGSKGSEDGQLLFPRGVVVDLQGNYIVTDRHNHRVQVFGPTGAFVRKFGLEGYGDGELQAPVGVGILSTTDIVVSENRNNRLQVFDREGGKVAILGSNGTLSFPLYLFVDSNDNILVADFANDRVLVYTHLGRLVSTIGKGKLNGPTGVCMDRDGRIIVVEGRTHRISIF